MNLRSLLQDSNSNALKLDRTSLKNQATELLRERIISAHIPPGTKLVERELAQLLGISRMPVRDALMDLEREGLVVTKPGGRYVIKLTEDDIRHLYKVRLVLEKLAVELAVHHASPQNCAMLTNNLQDMRAAIAHNDLKAYILADLEAHKIIWRQACNPHLLKMLHSIIGPIFMFIASQTKLQENWHETLQLHEELATAICAGDEAAATHSIADQLDNSFQLSLQVFSNPRS